MIRADRFIAEQMNISRSDAAAAVRSGRVTVNGRRLSPSDKIDEGKDAVMFDGRQVRYRRNVYIMLNKPVGVICAARDRLTETVADLIPPELRRKGLFPAGRLDKDTTGFVFITDDGAMAHDMLSPKKHVEKEYVVTLRDPVTDRERYISVISAGMEIDGGEICRPAVISFTDDPSVVHLVLCEGKYHQVKRMMHALGNEVTALRRIRIGGLVLDESLAEGQCRELSGDEVRKICTIS